MEQKIDSGNGRILAAIDLGSNSFHLGIARVIAGDIQPMHRLKQRVQLAENTDDSGNLSPEAMERGLECLKQFSQRLSEMHFDQIRIVATYALRQAPNRYQFIEQARAILDHPIEVIPGREEARLIYQGVSQNQIIATPTLVIDIGGGSTELVIGQGHTPVQLESLSMGCVSFQSRFFGEGKLSSKRMKKAILAAEQQLELLQQRYLHTGFEAAIGCSGTIKAIALLLNDGDLSAPISLKALLQLARTIGEHDHVDQLPFEQLAELRRKVLPSGLAILIACFRQLDIEQMQFSEFALREGVLSELANQDVHLNIQARTIQSLQQRYQLDTHHSVRIQASAQQLYRQFSNNKKRLALWLDYAAAVHEIGLQVNYRGIHKHGEYILSNANLSGFNTEEQQLLAFLVRWQRKKLSGCQSPQLQMLNNSQLWPLLIALRLSIMLHLGRRHHITLPQLQQQDNTLTLTFSEQLSGDDLLVADLEQEQLHLKELGWQLQWQ
ncbi:Ppx/GppA phosphatase family protein [Ferrimonas sp. SCSIO 43195]|uniref:Ppx/GppA phosphatase family protein n=1 Tax=Ferrimonas sp. SCSIO 43195 TaxID=2822844 RepID=UPI002075EAD4|nr:Ppx/GppA phosphatase family protein [Ferrimonas sp. SCSIO 43195]USD38282.1 Ppx/GppA family phosphatase [Ferrimonas sp. SCSIO 43195]